MEVIITPKALKQYNRLPKIEQTKIKKKLVILEQNPQDGKKLSGEFESLRSLRAWPYRVIYLIDEKQEKIFVVTIMHKQGVYK
jgi:mRNA-degrading endonuclease RelE of RelBE toxin-antitoxin system